MACNDDVDGASVGGCEFVRVGWLNRAKCVQSLGGWLLGSEPDLEQGEQMSDSDFPFVTGRSIWI